MNPGILALGGGWQLIPYLVPLWSGDGKPQLPIQLRALLCPSGRKLWVILPRQPVWPACQEPN